jgi:NADPH:quinone reductase
MAADSIALKPFGLEDTDAAAVPLAGVTALTALTTLGLAQGSTLVVLGASGGVGSFLVQLAQVEGFEVIAVCSAGNHDYVRTLGVSAAVDYADADAMTAMVGALGEAPRNRRPGW